MPQYPGGRHPSRYAPQARATERPHARAVGRRRARAAPTGRQRGRAAQREARAAHARPRQRLVVVRFAGRAPVPLAARPARARRTHGPAELGRETGAGGRCRPVSRRAPTDATLVPRGAGPCLSRGKQRGMAAPGTQNRPPGEWISSKRPNRFEIGLACDGSRVVHIRGNQNSLCAATWSSLAHTASIAATRSVPPCRTCVGCTFESSLAPLMRAREGSFPSSVAQHQDGDVAGGRTP